MFCKINDCEKYKNPENDYIEQSETDIVKIKEYEAPAEIQKQLNKE
jgi:hypothetical protein